MKRGKQRSGHEGCGLACRRGRNSNPIDRGCASRKSWRRGLGPIPRLAPRSGAADISWPRRGRRTTHGSLPSWAPPEGLCDFGDVGSRGNSLFLGSACPLTDLVERRLPKGGIPDRIFLWRISATYLGGCLSPDGPWYAEFEALRERPGNRTLGGARSRLGLPRPPQDALGRFRRVEPIRIDSVGRKLFNLPGHEHCLNSAPF